MQQRLKRHWDPSISFQSLENIDTHTICAAEDDALTIIESQQSYEEQQISSEDPATVNRSKSHSEFEAMFETSRVYRQIYRCTGDMSFAETFLFLISTLYFFVSEMVSSFISNLFFLCSFQH